MDYKIALPAAVVSVVGALMSGTLLGETFGAQYALKKGDVWMGRLFMAASGLLAIKLLFQDIL